LRLRKINDIYIFIADFRKLWLLVT